MNIEFCQIVGQVAAYLDKHPDGADRLRAFLDDDKLLYDTADVCRITGWGRTYVSQLCSSGLVPYIPGKPHKFVPAAVKKAIEALQTGGIYGRRKSRTKPTRRTP
ncbi:MAG: hypothetical protein JJE30_08930 [Desulfuromonadales bacterium]|nr:hypothetical protein [Desulfuromonadales bacterium]